jgi:hypothetical protein
MVAGAHHQNWLAHVMDTVGNILGGDTTLHVTKKADGSVEVTHDPSMEGEKWGRVAAAALGGASRGLAVGQGPGGPARAAAAGIQSGLQQPAQQLEQANQEATAEQERMMRGANIARLNQEVVRGAWDNAHLSRNDLQQQADYALDHKTKLDNMGAIPVAMNVTDHDKLTSFGVSDPQSVGAHMGQNGELLFNEPDGKNGVNFYRIPADVAKQRTTEDDHWTETKLDPNDQTKTIEVPHVSKAGSETNEHQLMRQMAQSGLDDKVKKQAFDAKIAQQNEKDRAQAEKDRAAYQRGSIAARREATAATAESRKETIQLRKDLSGIGEGENAADLSTAIASGHMTIDRLGYLAARNPALMASVMQKDPSFDSSKAASYPAVYKEYTSTKKGTAGAALNAGATALKHMQELKALNTYESHIPGTNDYTAYMNKAETLSSELAQLYGTTTIPAIKGIHDSLTTTLPGNRDSAIETQAQSMGDKLDSYEQSWKNAAPSSAYEADMPQIDEKAKTARAALDPNYRARLTQERTSKATGGAPPPPPPAGGGTPPTPPPIDKVPLGHDTTFANGQIWRNDRGTLKFLGNTPKASK